MATTPATQAALDADPTIQAAVTAYNAAVGPLSQSANSGGNRASANPAILKAKQAFGDAIKQSPLYGDLPQDYQINYDGSLEHVSSFTPTDLALIIGGSLVTAGMLGGATGGGSSVSTVTAPASPTVTTASPFAGAVGAGPLAGGETGMAATTAATQVPADLAALPATAGGSTLAKISSLLPDLGKAVGAATTAAGNNNLNQENAGLEAAGIDIKGQQAYTDEEIAIAKENAAMQNQQLKDKYLAEKATNPSVSPFDPTGGPKYSPGYISTLSQLANQNPDLLTAPTPYTPITPSGAQAATGTTPGTLSKIGQILGPVSTVLPSISKIIQAV